MLIKRPEQPRENAAAPTDPAPVGRGLDRRSFLSRSGLVAGGLAGLGTLPFSSIRQSHAGEPPPEGASVSRHKNVCTHCSVGCSVIGEVDERRMDGAGAGLRQPHQSRLALL